MKKPKKKIKKTKPTKPVDPARLAFRDKFFDNRIEDEVWYMGYPKEGF